MTNIESENNEVNLRVLKRKKYSNYQGIYKGNNLRSYIELLVALELEYIQKVKFKSEGIILKDEKGRKKIPDFVVYKENNEIDYLIEIKGHLEDQQQLIKEYIDRKIDTKNYKIEFQYLDCQKRRLLEKSLIDYIGIDLFNSIVSDFKMQASDATIFTQTSFKGESHPCFGIKFSKETCAKISLKAKVNNVGTGNPMYGKNHSDKTKLQISENSQWKDPARKNLMKRNGFITHISRFDTNEKVIFKDYLDIVLVDKKSKKPMFVNGAYCLNYERTINLFNSLSEFASELSKLNINIDIDKIENERKIWLESEKIRIASLNGKRRSSKRTEKTKLLQSLNSPHADPAKRKIIKEKSILKFISSLDTDKRAIINKYLEDLLSNIQCNKPDFLKRAYALNKEIIEKIFGSIESFISKIKEIDNVITEGESNIR